MNPVTPHLDLKNPAAPEGDSVRSRVRENYGQIARSSGTSDCCSPTGGSSCCGAPSEASLEAAAQLIGYSFQELKTLPEGANLGLGCGNPQAIANLKTGETVLDLGSGGGIDCFLAAKAVGPSGRVIGVDMTHDMLALARKNAVKGGFANVEFRLGEIEHLPVADNTVDVIISNCVINLSPDKPQVFAEAFRVLRSGGRLAVSDMVASAPLPPQLKGDLELHSKCISGSTPLGELQTLLTAAGFTEIKIQPKSESRAFVKDWAPGTGIEDFILSATIEARKP